MIWLLLGLIGLMIAPEYHKDTDNLRSNLAGAVFDNDYFRNYCNNF